MPNFDAGHYFLTALVPLLTEPEHVNGQNHSRRHRVKEALAWLPSGERTVKSGGKGAGSPFARSLRTHFIRLFLLEDVVFNGRPWAEPLIARLRGRDPMVPGKVDRLTTPFLVIAADFDAASGDDAELASYAAELWASMEPEIRGVLKHCVAFDTVDGPDSFFRYIKRCQVETTMPFNDYWSTMPDLPDLDIKPYGYALIAGLVLLLVGAFVPGLRWLLLVGPLVLAGAVVLGLRAVNAAAQRPFPRAPNPAPSSGLPSVLKALYLQRAFTDFAIEAQTLRANDASGAALHAAFGRFLADHKPNDVQDPSQEPGIIGVPTGISA